MEKYVPPCCESEQVLPLLTLLAASTEDYPVDYQDPGFN